jgi:hypothetical protein
MVAMDTNKSPEIWDQLTIETARAYEAFKVFMFISPAERSLVGAWREWTDNPEAKRPSPFFEEWAREYAWSERARAHDAHIERIRRRAMEKAIEEEAEFQTRQTEQLRNRMLELMTVGYDAAMSWFEDSDRVKDNLRSGDVLKIIALHLDAAEKFGVLKAEEGIAEGDWDESKLEKDAKGDAEADRILADARALRERRRAEGHVDEPEEDLL